MKPIYECEYCSFRGIETEVAAHEKKCEYNPDNSVENEKKTTVCYCHTNKHDTDVSYYYTFTYYCGECGEWIKSDFDDEELKLCPYCGAQYEKIVKD